MPPVDGQSRKKRRSRTRGGSGRRGSRRRQPTRSGTAPAAATGANNSMPMADKPYEAPEPPEDIDSYMPGLAEEARRYRETIRPEERNYITMYFRVRRRNYEQLLWQYCSTGVFTRDKMYMPQSLPYWTVSMRLRLRRNFPLGRVLETMKCRLGITSPGLRFCLDGYYGMVNYTDIFGNTADVCPWMEVSSFSTVESLRLRDSDSIFVSIASAGQIENVMKWRKRHFAETAETSLPASGKEVHFSGVRESEFKQLVI